MWGPMKRKVKGQNGEQPNLIKDHVANTSFVCNHVAHRGGKGQEKRKGERRQNGDAPSYDLYNRPRTHPNRRRVYTHARANYTVFMMLFRPGPARP